MYHLPAYVAIERWAPGRVIVVVAPRTADGPRRLRDAGARVIVIGSLRTERGIEVRAGTPELPLPDGSVHMVACIEGYADLSPQQRARMLVEAKRILQPDGVMVAWTEHDDAPGKVDFWTLERELGAAFARVQMIAQIPWRGFSLAPVLDEGAAAPAVVVRESLLVEPPAPTHYLALAGDEAARDRLGAALQCVLVPMAFEAEVVELASERTSPELPAPTEPSPAEVTAAAEHEALQQREAELALQREALQQRGAELLAEREAARLREAELVAEREALRQRGSELAWEREIGLQREQELTAERVATARREAELAAEREAAAERDSELERTRARLLALERDLQEARAWTESSAAELAEARAKAQAHEGELGLALRTAEERVRAAEERLRTRETDVAVLTRTTRELEQSLTRTSERAESRAKELEERNAALAELRGRIEGAAGEREQLTRQLEIASVEREAARQLTARFESEIDLARRRATSTEEQLAQRMTEAARLAAEVSMLRERLEQQESMLTQTRTRAEELSASVAHGAEQGRMLAEVAIDRDRLREELGRRTAALEKLEERLWTARDDTQRERLDNVKIGGELERLREQLERTRQVEASKTNEVERLGAELRRVELERSEALGLLRTREDELARMRRELDALASSSVDLQRLRGELDVRARELAELGAQLEHARAGQREAENVLRRREQQLVDAGAELERLHREVDERSLVAGGVQSELDVRMVELEQLAASIGDLQQQIESLRADRRAGEARAVELQRHVEELAAERELLRRHLREREQELDDVASAQESHGAELVLLRRELEAASEVNERLSGASPPGTESAEQERMREWPDEAVAEVLRLRAELGARGRESVEVIAARERVEDVVGDRGRMRRLQLELDIRAQEHEHVLALLDGAEQRIWEMTDASDRNAARLAAGLAQLEKQREQLDDTLEELDVTRNLLAAAQARTIEQERLLSSERAKLARVGFGAEQGGSNDSEAENVEELFAELDVGYRSSVDVQPILLPTAATRAHLASDRRQETSAVPTPVTDAGSSGSGSRAIELRSSPRVVVEALTDDAWDAAGEPDREHDREHAGQAEPKRGT